MDPIHMEMNHVFLHNDVESQRSIRSNTSDHYKSDHHLMALVDSSHSPETHITSAKVSRPRIGNPKPLGLFAFALTTTVLSLINLHSRGVTTPNIVVGLGLAYGGVAFASYGTFWIAYSMILIPWFGIQDSYAANPSEFQNAMGHFIICIL